MCWALSWRYNLRRIAFCALIGILLLLATLPLSAQSSPLSPPISNQDWIQSNVDLAIVKAQLSAYREALRIATIERDNLKAQLDQHSIDSERQSQEQRQELEKLTQRLADLNSTISALEVNSDSAAKRVKELTDKTEADYKAQMKSLECENLVLKWGVGILVVFTAAGIVDVVGQVKGWW